MELRELLQRWQQAGESVKAFARSTGLACNAVGKCLKAAKALGLTLSGLSATAKHLTPHRALAVQILCV